eukprot:m.7187 g.7187  ORF g.7187 m.7187 type:complete len:190 (+) comp17957_c0_seq1:48-617(+)
MMKGLLRRIRLRLGTYSIDLLMEQKDNSTKSQDDLNSVQSRTAAFLDLDLSTSEHNCPIQPSLSSFPSTAFGSRRRSFCAEWYKKFPLIEYSVTKDAIFCFPCRRFIVGASVGRLEPAFTSTGFRNWKKALGKCGVLHKHSDSRNHKTAMVLWQQQKLLLAQTKLTTLAVECKLQGEDDVALNRSYLKC